MHPVALFGQIPGILGWSYERGDCDTTIHILGRKNRLPNETIETIQKITQVAATIIKVFLAAYTISVVPIWSLAGIFMYDIPPLIVARIQETLKRLDFEGKLFVTLFTIFFEPLRDIIIGGGVVTMGLYVGSQVRYHGREAFQHMFNMIDNHGRDGDEEDFIED